MKVRFGFLSTLAGLVLLWSGCDAVSPNPDERRADGEGAGVNTNALSEECVSLNAYKVCYDGRTVSADDASTTFTYTVTLLKGSPNLNYFFLEVPDYARPELGGSYGLVGYDPSNAAKLGENKDVPEYYGLTWEPSVSTTQAYSYTFHGDVPEGQVAVIIRSGKKIAGPKVLPGPGAAGDIGGSYSIGGRVFIDSDAEGQTGYGTWEDTEFGRGGIRVTLYSGASTEAVAEQITDASGAYSFGGLAEGAYRVAIENTAENGLFYETNTSGSLYAFTSGALVNGIAQRTVQVGPSVTTADFGYALLEDGMVNALGGAYETKNTLPFRDYVALLSGLLEYEDVLSGKMQPYETLVNDFRLQFRGRHYDGANTTYYYRIIGTSAGFDVSHWTVQLLSQYMPSDWSPTQVTFGLDPTTGMEGIKYDISVSKNGSADFSLTFPGLPAPGVLDIALKTGRLRGGARMPGAYVNAVGDTPQIVNALSNIFYSGSSDADYLFLKKPLELLSGEDEAMAAARIMIQPETLDIHRLEKLLLGAQLIYKLGLGSPNTWLDESVFQYVEPIMQELYGSTTSSSVEMTLGPASSFVMGGVARGAHAGTGSSRGGERMLSSYY